ncbi:hypothetical protein CkaCkLH20_12825 [Colletotrichum karsti]|uniref:Uncharacterized protein n=1 Tax=Colletotrichum karsti TaxID=1095194 RepID=A0A9P6LDV9_9PEZI|nr:uncharacterized protein CkaCkLH20_12825 [Colletotrichum karsti]KAF9869638.1 hypothetical protein CkaCkLH20_12825 [Colletotrichum karsti]
MSEAAGAASGASSDDQNLLLASHLSSNPLPSSIPRESLSPTDAALFQLQDFQWDEETAKDFSQSVDAFLDGLEHQSSGQPAADTSLAHHQVAENPLPETVDQLEVNVTGNIADQIPTQSFNQVAAQPADRTSEQHIDQAPQSTTPQTPERIQGQVSQRTPKQTSSPLSTTSSSVPKMKASAHEVERFNDKDETTGRPRLQQSWINYALRVMKWDKNGEIWHPDLRQKILDDLEHPVTVHNLTVSRNRLYKSLTAFARGKKQQYYEVDFWAILFRNENGLPEVWVDGENSDLVWAFSDVINAIVDHESTASIMSNYGKTRNSKNVFYFQPGSANTLSKPANARTVQGQGGNPQTPKKRKTEDRDAIVIASDRSDVDESPQEKRRKTNRGAYIQSTVEKRTLRKRNKGGNEAVVSGDQSTQKPDHDTESEMENTNTGNSQIKKTESDTEPDPESEEGSMAGDDDDEDDSELMDSWMVEALKAQEEKKAEVEVKPKVTVKQKIEQRNNFFKTLTSMSKEHQDMAFRTSVLDMLQGLGVDPTTSLSKQMKRYKTTFGGDEKQKLKK